ncbi:MAG TPA: APC family permease [Thermoanaerobaculia bacterium]|jgi:amino acid transporter|nr:APC family permease [Thermoanaerobaculia bacterium]
MTTGLRRDLGTIESYATLLGMLIGAGIFKVTGVAWQLTGPSVILGYVVLGPAVIATSVAYSVFLSTPLGREPGGEYTNISRTFGGYGLAYIGAWLKIISYIGALAYLARAFADYAQQLVRIDATVLAVGALAFFYAIHVAGVRWFGRLQVWMCMVLGVSLVVLIVPGLFAIHRDYYVPFFAHGLRGFAASLPPLFFAYAGFESLAQAAGEVSDSTRRLPRVFVRGISATLVIYFLMSLVGLGTLSPERLRVSTAPMADAAASYLSIGGAAVVTIGALMALLTSVNATMLVPSRIALVLANDRLAPRWIGSVSPRTSTPIAGLTLTLAGALALLLTNQIGLALNIAVYALVLLYLLHSVALLLLPRLNPELFALVTVSLPLWLQRALAILSIVSMAALMIQISVPAIELLLFWTAIGAALYLWSRRVANRRAAGGIEHAEETELA